MEVANRLIDSMTDRFFLSGRFPYMGRPRDEDLGAGYRSFAVGDYVVVYAVEGEDVLVLRVALARREYNLCGE